MAKTVTVQSELHPSVFFVHEPQQPLSVTTIFFIFWRRRAGRASPGQHVAAGLMAA